MLTIAVIVIGLFVIILDFRVKMAVKSINDFIEESTEDLAEIGILLEERLNPPKRKKGRPKGSKNKK